MMTVKLCACSPTGPVSRWTRLGSARRRPKPGGGRIGDMARSDSELDAVALARIRGICQRFVGADEGELQSRPLFRVGRRRFAIFNGQTSPPRPRWNASGRSLHFLADPLEID